MPSFPNEIPSDSSISPEMAARRGTVGMLLFLAALFMLFAASIVGYVLIRLQITHAPEVPLSNGYSRPIVALQTLELPSMLWVSTFLVVGVSVAISLAQAFFARGLHQPYRKALIAALALGAGFVTVQTPAMVSLLMSQSAGREKFGHLYGLLFFLVLLHALHVIGGMIGLGRLAMRVQHGGYNPTDPGPTKHIALYWHFLDAIWIAMFATFYLLK